MQIAETGVWRVDVLAGDREVQRYGVGSAAVRGAEQGEGFYSGKTCE